MRLSGISRKSTDVGTYYTYLSLLAFKLFETNSIGLSPSDFAALHEQFENEYAMRKNREEMIQQLQDARILGSVGDDIGFLHKYCYYFFVANYFQKVLADNPQDQAVKSKLRQMADMVHDDEYMNILIFYIYLTEDRQIIEYLIERAKGFFDEYPPCDLENDVAFVVDLMKPRKLEMSPGAFQKNRERHQEQKDEAMENEEEKEKTAARTKYDRSLDDSIRLDFAFHALQVMGQVLRNFPGDLRADLKRQLAHESYALGLRTMKAYMTALETNVVEIRESIESMLKFYRAKTDDAAQRESSQILANLAEAGIFITIKRVSFSVGLEDLRETYASVRKGFGESFLPTRLIDLSIQLDHFPKLPMSDIKELQKSTKGIVPYNILLMLVNERLHLFPVDYRDRQRISDWFKVDLRASLIADKKVVKEQE